MRDVSPFQHTLCASTSCGNNAYLCPREAYPRGGYEAWVGRTLGAYLLAENIDDVLVRENLKLLEQSYTKAYPALPSCRIVQASLSLLRREAPLARIIHE
jgi:hypothetical protein